jgi:hypothetical protein
MPLSVLSALVRLGVSAFIATHARSGGATGPADRRIAGDVPPPARGTGNRQWPYQSAPEARPSRNIGAASSDMASLPRPTVAKLSEFWIASFVLAAAILVSVAIQGGFPFGIGIR